MIMDLSRRSTDEFLSLPILKNKLFTYRNRSVYFENCIKAEILYTTDLFDENGSLYDIQNFYNKQHIMRISYYEYNV